MLMYTSNFKNLVFRQNIGVKLPMSNYFISLKFEKYGFLRDSKSKAGIYIRATNTRVYTASVILCSSVCIFMNIDVSLRGNYADMTTEIKKRFF